MVQAHFQHQGAFNAIKRTGNSLTFVSLVSRTPVKIRSIHVSAPRRTQQRPRSQVMDADLSTLSQQALIDRCTDLQQQLKSQAVQIAALTADAQRQQTPSPLPTARKGIKSFDSSRHATRFIAFKLSYLGHKYNGFEHANRCFTPLPTVEEVLWKALRKTRLIDPPIPDGADTSFEVIGDPKEREQRYVVHGKTRPSEMSGRSRLDISWEGCQYSKCGRTDRGVSAFGQVIGIRVRSNRPVHRGVQTHSNGDVVPNVPSEAPVAEEVNKLEAHSFDDINDELPYVYMLNMVLPPDIRILAWCPHPPEGFDARYSCLERRYKYFFTNPAFCPTPGPIGLVHADGSHAPVREGWLDIDRMRDAARRLIGLHDFRNLCQIDASKQMSNCQRRILHADIEEVDSAPLAFSSNANLNATGQGLPQSSATTCEAQHPEPKVYAIVIHGTAFLWHQVRCTASVLFMVGQGLESPDVVDRLLDIEATPGRPHYAMADDAPLVLWDCVFPGDENGKEGLRWIYSGDEATLPSLTSKSDGQFGIGGVVDELWAQWQEAKIKEAQIGGLLSLVIAQGDDTAFRRGGFRDPSSVKSRSQKLFEGIGQARLNGAYKPLLTRRLMDPLEVLNAKYLQTVKGARRQAKRENESSQK